jgi:hypothetical protein
MSELIRPLASRVEEARVNLASFPVVLEPLVFDLSEGARALELRPPGVAVEVREQVLREALNDGLAYHCSESCPHVAESGWLCAVFVQSRITCGRCIYVKEYDEDGRPIEREPWQGTGEAPCTLCSGDGPLVSILTRTSHPDGMVYASHVCATCAAWWPRGEPPEPELAPPAANVGVRVRMKEPMEGRAVIVGCE